MIFFHYPLRLFDFLQKIICNTKHGANCTEIIITDEIIDLCQLHEKFALILLGWKYDHSSLVSQNIMVLDILEYIIHLFVQSVKLI